MGAYLSGSDLSGALLDGVSLAGADLRSATFRGAMCRGTRFGTCEMDMADLRGANLPGQPSRTRYIDPRGGLFALHRAGGSNWCSAQSIRPGTRLLESDDPLHNEGDSLESLIKEQGQDA